MEDVYCGEILHAKHRNNAGIEELFVCQCVCLCVLTWL